MLSSTKFNTKKNIKTNQGKSEKTNSVTEQHLNQATVADYLVNMLHDLGVRHAFGVSGGAIAPIWEALEKSPIEVLHFRHEAGAAFAATEAHFATRRPIVVFATTGPGITNVLTGIIAAKGEGAKVILVSASTPTQLRGRGALQETSKQTLPEEIFQIGMLFDYATCMESSEEIPFIYQKLNSGLSKADGFVAHISIPTNIQTSITEFTNPIIPVDKFVIPTVDQKVITQIAELLSSESFAIWVGFGARNATTEILELTHKTGALVMSSPRGKGIFPENHPQYMGVTGFAGHDLVLEYMQSTPPERILVLGSRLGEFTSFWNPIMIPPKGFIHVDIKPHVPGSAYSLAKTFPVCADIKTFLMQLLHQLPQKVDWLPAIKMDVKRTEEKGDYQGLVRPKALMEAIQKIVIEGFDDTIVMAEGGNSFAWATQHLIFSQPNRWRVSTGFASMGHMTTAVVGAGISQKKAVAIVGDGSMLMNNEISTAVQYNIPSVWIILNDSTYNMCNQGMKKLGYKHVKTNIPSVDFVMFARSLGADGISVEKESELEVALFKAMNAKVPFIVDVKIDPNEPAPIGKRITSLIEQKF